MREVRCPKCGSLMILRQVKRGINTGEQFYGCSRYPKCNATVPLEYEDSNPLEAEKEKKSLTRSSFPQNLFARARFQDYQTTFFETVAVPENLLEHIRYEDPDEEILKAFSQWRLDFPFTESNSTLTEKHHQIISVLKKILTRGRITLPSPKVEKEFKEIFKPQKIEFSLSLIESLVVVGYAKGQKRIWLDSEEERIFYEDILLKLLGKNCDQFIIPQVEISSLISPIINKDNTGNQRVDFAIFHPKLKEKIIVEIDGEQHRVHKESDKERDKALQENGYTVIRIPVEEIRKRKGKQLSLLISIISVIKKRPTNNLCFLNDEILKYIYSIKISQQIQLTLLEAIKSNFLHLEDKESWYIFTDLDEIDLFDKKESLTILKKSVEDFIELLEKIHKIYSVNLNIVEPVCKLISEYTIAQSKSTIFISFSHKKTTDLSTFYIQNIYFPFNIANSSFPAEPIIEGLNKPEEKDLEYFLQYLFRKTNFWEGQYDGITLALQGKDGLLLLPTGAGKSLVYQLASLLLPGCTVVIDPIISLMEDQIDNLSMIGIDRTIAITSQIEDPIDRQKALKLFGQGEYLFAYVAPERFQTDEFRQSLRTLTVHTPISLIVVDEAHCVSEWGHDFRTAYLNIGRISREYCKSNRKIPPLLALTGTASRAVLKDVQRELLIEDFDAIVTPKSFDRKELKFQIIYSPSQEKIARLKGYLGQKLSNLFNTTVSSLYQTRGKETFSGLVFCPHVSGEFGVERVADEIRKNLNISVGIYSGKEPKNWNTYQWHYHKNRVTKEFKRNKIPLLVCTKAFGMGIDKPNIRYTIHFGLPPSIESFYQEAGRAGRDRKTAYCQIIVSNDDHERSKKLLNPNTKVEEIDEIIKKIKWEENDDITRVFYFHINSFRGISKEKDDVQEVLRQIGDTSKKGVKILSIPDKFKQSADERIYAREIMEKALHRLLLIGVISDYTIEYSREEFTIKLSGATKEKIIENYGKYVASYLFSRKQTEIEKAKLLLSLPQPDFVIEMISLLLHFVYDVIERGRRRAFSEMLLACSDSPNDQDFRKRILQYLEATEYSEALEKIINDEKAGLIKCRDVFNMVRSPNEAAELRGQVSRYLESYPDHPALLMLRSLSEVYSRNKKIEVARENFTASIKSARTNYGLEEEKVFEFSIWAISEITRRDEKLAKELISILLADYPIRKFAIMMIVNLPINLCSEPAWFLLEEIQKECNFLINKIGNQNGKRSTKVLGS